MEGSSSPVPRNVGHLSDGRQIVRNNNHFESTSTGCSPISNTTGTKLNNIVSFGKDFFSLKRTKRLQNQIIPNAGQRSNPDLFKSTIHHPTPQVASSAREKDKSKGFRKFLSMIKRNELPSQNAEVNHFVRGGHRSTAGPRLMSGEKRRVEINVPFPRFNNILLAQWFNTIGLGMYSEQCKRIVRSGEQLLNLTEAEVEKYLGIKNKLHRKKLKLALAFANNDCDSLTQAAHKLDYLWVARWLDDIGLPQYKESFINARVDGAVLNQLTVQELIHLNINTKIHYCSIKRGIQVLREQKFDPNCLERRAIAQNSVEGGEKEETSINPTSIALWTSHRVMEWLRCIDLSEYTSSLRGSGVHGAFIIHEPAFDADLLAFLLGIPSSKTLLRRYINTHFNNLIGSELVQVKRDYKLKNPSPLTPSKISIKVSRFSIIKRRTKPEFQPDDLVCPLSPNLAETKPPCPKHGTTANSGPTKPNYNSLTSEFNV